MKHCASCLTSPVFVISNISLGTLSPMRLTCGLYGRFGVILPRNIAFCTVCYSVFNIRACNLWITFLFHYWLTLNLTLAGHLPLALDILYLFASNIFPPGQVTLQCQRSFLGSSVIMVL